MMNAKLLALCVSTALLGGCRHEGDREEGPERATREIQTAYDNWAKAFAAKDLNGVMAMYAPGADLIAYDIVPPLQYKGADAYRKDYADFFAQFAGPIQVQIADQHIEAGRTVAFAYGLEHLTGKLTNGTNLDAWIRWTDGWKRMDDGRWRVVHEHISVPIDMATGKARMDLKP
jgi:ketosteroid isomerase-like protein